jgi:hypothetical protein
MYNNLMLERNKLIIQETKLLIKLEKIREQYGICQKKTQAVFDSGKQVEFEIQCIHETLKSMNAQLSSLRPITPAEPSTASITQE